MPNNQNPTKLSLQLLADNISDVVTCWDKDLQLTYANKTFKDKTGVNKPILSGKHIMETGLPQSFITVFNQKLQQVFNTGSATEIGNGDSIAGGDGSFHTYFIPAYNTKGETESVIVIEKDQTELNSTAPQLKGNTNLLQSVADISLNSLSVLKPIRNSINTIVDFEWVFANKEVKRRTHYQNLIGEKFRAVYQSPDIDHWLKRYADVTDSGHTADFEDMYRTPDGDKWFHVVAQKLGDNIMVTSEDITGRKNIEQELRHREELLHLVFDASPHAISAFRIVHDNNGEVADFEILTHNESAGKIFGKNAIGKLLSKLLPKILETGVFDEFKKVALTGEPADFERWNPLDRGDRWFRYKIKKAADLLVVATEDITESKEASQQIRETKELLESIFDTTLIGLSIFKAVRNDRGAVEDFRIELVNKHIIKGTGREDLVGKLYSNEFPGIKDSGLLDLMIEAHGSATPVVTEYHYNYDGFDKWYSSMFINADDGLVATTVDITARKNAEDELLKNFTLLQQTEVLADTGSWEYDHNTKQFSWSDGMYRLFNLEKTASVSPAVYIDYAIDADKEIAERITAHITTHFTAFQEILRIETAGIIKTLKVKGAPLKNGSEEVNKVLGIDMDITTLKESEETIKLLNQTLTARNRELNASNSELQTFTSIAANDYNDTLRHLYTSLEFIISKDARNLSDSGKANLRRAQAAIQKMKLLTEDMVAFSRIQLLDRYPQLVDLDKVLATVTEDLKEKIAHENATINTENLPSIKGFPMLLSLLFYHLLQNALMFRKEEPLLIKIQYNKTKETFDEAGTNDPGLLWHVITITDNGSGFDESEAEQIFSLFYRIPGKSKHKGSGVGLAVCRKIMDLHHGYLKARSRQGEGAQFSCYFPAEGETKPA